MLPRASTPKYYSAPSRIMKAPEYYTESSKFYTTKNLSCGSILSFLVVDKNNSADADVLMLQAGLMGPGLITGVLMSSGYS
ncbi:hypothetical protein DAPPUDRAFT_232923 [Daphnia pulex]|uniref:Uncharacterized protein n=1 Tax=Daphnia pulex TaxID=6669 RepID=E9FSQ4_DAPPU|nr:hypothetical protein DAPPUDRAFT_232923 [Daphnia pulex]|eukprot:EFX89783.1 hypothetical protein DAPPUDRAFT_232923 [Daphnia pulex]